MSAPGPVPHALTVDVEDWFQVSAFEGVVPRSAWGTYEDRVERNTDGLLDLFAEHGVRATFFVLGWVAERHPDLVRRLAEAGHEIASHGYEHRRVSSLTPASFRADLRRAAACIEAASGVPVRGFRAPSFSITPRTLWAYDVLREEGYVFSSSVFPVRHDHYGIPTFPRHPLRLAGDDGRALWELPMSTWRVLGRNLPAAGGGWLRALPPAVTRRALEDAARRGVPGVVYVHPWELDPGQPRLRAAPWRKRLRHRLNLSRTAARLRALLSRYAFATVSEALAAYAAREPGPRALDRRRLEEVLT